MRIGSAGLHSASSSHSEPCVANDAQARAAQRINLELAAKDKAPVLQEEDSKPAAQGEASAMCVRAAPHLTHIALTRPIRPIPRGRVLRLPTAPAAKSSAAPVVSSPPTVVAEAPVKASSPVPAPPSKPPAMAAPPSGAAAGPAAPEIASYEISPYKSGSDSDEEERPRKPVPSWARTEAVLTALQTQVKADPDAIFMNPQRTCSLVDVFQYTHNKKRDFTRRGSSGNWAEDQLTWKARAWRVEGAWGQ